MTRREVAQRLGKSVATVRRLEGVLLHPARDQRGRRHFDPTEVERLAVGIDCGDVVVWQHMSGASEPLKGISMNDPEYSSTCPRCSDRDRAVAQLREELDAMERKYRREVDSLRSERERYRAEQRQLERELRRFVAEVIDAS